MLSVHSILSKRRLWWLGHVRRMSSERIPRALLYCELATGMTKIGHSCLRFKHVCKKDLSLADDKTWDTIAEERTSWRAKVCVGASLIALSEERRARRKGRGGRGVGIHTIVLP